jgi:hypothetical protein
MAQDQPPPFELIVGPGDDATVLSLAGTAPHMTMSRVAQSLGATGGAMGEADRPPECVQPSSWVSLRWLTLERLDTHRHGFRPSPSSIPSPHTRPTASYSFRRAMRWTRVIEGGVKKREDKGPE